MILPLLLTIFVYLPVQVNTQNFFCFVLCYQHNKCSGTRYDQCSGDSNNRCADNFRRVTFDWPF
jgi:hypothetical protein